MTKNKSHDHSVTYDKDPQAYVDHACAAAIKALMSGDELKYRQCLDNILAAIKVSGKLHQEIHLNAPLERALQDKVTFDFARFLVERCHVTPSLKQVIKFEANLSDEYQQPSAEKGSVARILQALSVHAASQGLSVTKKNSRYILQTNMNEPVAHEMTHSIERPETKSSDELSPESLSDFTPKKLR